MRLNTDVILLLPSGAFILKDAQRHIIPPLVRARQLP
jgi:hypothetical protein